MNAGNLVFLHPKPIEASGMKDDELDDLIQNWENKTYPSKGDNPNLSGQEEMIPKKLVARGSVNLIDKLNGKMYWARKYAKEVILALKANSGIMLSDEYEKKLEELDNIRPGEGVPILDVPGAKTKVDPVLLAKVSVYFTSEDHARRFLEPLKDLDNKQIIALVKKKYEDGVCTNISKDLWKVLHDAKLYKAGYSNWNAQLPKK